MAEPDIAEEPIAAATADVRLPALVGSATETSSAAPATPAFGPVAVGPNVRAMEPGDQVLFNPEDRYEVEVRGEDFIILRERDIHAVAAERLQEGSTGLYL